MAYIAITAMNPKEMITPKKIAVKIIANISVLLSGVKNLCWFPIISAVVTSYDRQGESFTSLPVSGLMAEDKLPRFIHVHSNVNDAAINGIEDHVTLIGGDDGITAISISVVSHF